MSFTVVERLVLVVLILATILVFVRDLRPKIRHILAGRSDRPRTDRLGRRIATVIKEVVFQSRTKWTYPDVTVIFDACRVSEVEF